MTASGPDLDLVLPAPQAGRLARLPALAAHRAGRARSQAVAVVWHDTPEGALAAAGLALAERQIGRARGWRLSALHATPPGTRPVLEAEGAAPDALGRPLPEPLLPVAACAGRLRHWPLDPAAGMAGMSVLDGRISTVGAAHPICRVRLHGVTDPALAAAFTAGLDLALAPETLAAAALGLAGRSVPAGAPPAVAEGQSISAALAALLARETAVLVRLAPLAASGTGTEPVHQMRVALRRLRSALTLFRRAIDDAALQALRPELKQLAQLLGPARDWDVFAAGTGAAVATALPEDRAIVRLLAAATRRRAESYAALAAHLHGPAFRGLCLRLAWLAAQRPWERPDDPAQARPLAEFAARELARRRARVRARGADLTTLPADALHALRIEVKRLRYACEFFAPLFPARAVRRLIRRTSAVQERLGHINDGTVAAGLLAALGGPARGYAAGVVTGFVAAERQRAAARADRAWRRLRHAAPFWT